MILSRNMQNHVANFSENDREISTNQLIRLKIDSLINFGPEQSQTADKLSLIEVACCSILDPKNTSCQATTESLQLLSNLLLIVEYLEND